VALSMEGGKSMWMVVYMAQTKETAEQIRNVLTAEGFLVKLKPVYKNVSSEENYYEILVPKSEANEAHDILMEKGF